MKKIIKYQKIGVYQNLPSGGAKSLYKLNLSALRKEYELVNLGDGKIDARAKKNIFYYFVSAIFSLRSHHKEIASKLDIDLLIVYHTWITKSPYILRYVESPKIYICHEAPREFYDIKYRASFNIYESIINVLRLPIKYIDMVNVKTAHNLTMVANSRYSKEIIDSIYGTNSQVIYPGIDVERYAIKETTRRRNQVLIVGAINKLKNQLFIAECLSAITNNRPSLLLIGNGGNKNYIKKIKDYCANHNIKVTVKINATENEIRKAYQESKLFVYAPEGEPFGIVILEAMASGLPIVAAKNGGGYTEILSEKNGKLVSGYDTKIWAAEIMKFLSDNNLWRNVSNYNIGYSKNFTYQKMNNNILRLI